MGKQEICTVGGGISPNGGSTRVMAGSSRCWSLQPAALQQRRAVPQEEVITLAEDIIEWLG